MAAIAVLSANADAICRGYKIAELSRPGHVTVPLTSTVSKICITVQGGVGKSPAGYTLGGRPGFLEGQLTLSPGQSTIDGAIGGGGAGAGPQRLNGGDAAAVWSENPSPELLAVGGGGGGAGPGLPFTGGDGGPTGAPAASANGLQGGASGLASGTGGAGGAGDTGGSTGGLGGVPGPPNGGGGGGNSQAGGGGGSTGAGGGGSAVTGYTAGGDAGSGTGAGAGDGHAGGGNGGDGGNSGGGGGYVSGALAIFAGGGAGGVGAGGGFGGGGGGAGYSGGGGGGASSAGTSAAGGGAGSNYASSRLTSVVNTMNVTAVGGAFLTVTTLDATGSAASSPSAHDFGEETVDYTTASQQFRISNIGSQPYTIDWMRVTGADAGDFVLDADGCMGGTVQGTVPQGTSCTVSVSFRPSAAGTRTAWLDTMSTGGNPSSALSGTGVAGHADVTLSPPSHDFGNQLLGTTSAAQTFTVANDGTATATLNSIELGGASAAEFSANSGDCTGSGPGQAGGRLAPGASCAVAVTFTPSRPGDHGASLVVDADGQTATSALSGTGGFTPRLPPGNGGGGGHGGEGGGHHGGGGGHHGGGGGSEPGGGSLYPPNATTAVFDGRRSLYLRVACPRAFRPRCTGKAFAYTTKVVRKKGRRHRKVVAITGRGRVAARAGSFEVVHLPVLGRHLRAVERMAREPKRRLLPVRVTIRARHYRHDRPRTHSTRYKVLLSRDNSAKPPATRPKHRAKHRPSPRRRGRGRR